MKKKRKKKARFNLFPLTFARARKKMSLTDLHVYRFIGIKHGYFFISIYLSLYLYIYIYIYIYICLSVCMSAYLCIYLHGYCVVSIYLSIYMSNNPDAL